jgi:hypothetical protein
MKKFIFSAAIIFTLVLAGCGDSSKENVDGTVNNDTSKNDDSEVSTSKNDKSKDKKGEGSQKINEVIIENDMYKITLTEILKKNDEMWGNTIDVVFEVENRLDYTIGVQARSVSADGYMVDESTYSMSQEVVAGKKAKAVLTINEFEGYEFPELNNNFEMTLLVFNYDSFEDIAEHPVNVSF